MHALTTTLPQISSLDQARGVVNSLFDELQQARWRVAQLEKQLYGPSSERKVEGALSKEQILLSLFPAPAQPAATQTVLSLPAQEKPPPSARRRAAAKAVEAMATQLRPQ